LVRLSIGSDFFASFKYAPTKARSPSVRDFTICGDYGQFSDFNVDGKWDERVLMYSEPGRKWVRTQVSYGGEWRDTTPGDRYGVYTQKLQDGSGVRFDMTRGEWVTGDKEVDDVGTHGEKKGKRPEPEGKDHDGSGKPRQSATAAAKARERTGDAGGPAPAKGIAQDDWATKELLASNDVYLSKPPYSVLLPKGARDARAFSLLVDGSIPLVFAVEPSRDELGKERDTESELHLNLGLDFDISCKYAPRGENGVKVREVSMTNDRDHFVDINADGKWDLRIASYNDDSKRRTQVWFHGEWRDTTQGDRPGLCFKNVKGGPAVTFDTKSGIWVPSEAARPAERKKVQ